MQYRRLGFSGLPVSVVGLGCNNFGRRIDLEATRAVVDAALEVGVTFFDTADVYGESEAFLGEVLQGRRDDVVLATKFGNPLRGALGDDHGARGSRWYIRRAVERSLRRLRTDHIDLYQMHQPTPHTARGDACGAHRARARGEGQVRRALQLQRMAGGACHWTARSGGYERFLSAQNEYSLIERTVEAELVPALEHYGVGLLPYFPLANGLLTGKYSRDAARPEGTRLHGADYDSYLTGERFDLVEALEEFAGERALSLLDVAIGGLAARRSVASVIARDATGAGAPERGGRLRAPSQEDRQLLEAVLQNAERRATVSIP